MFDSTRLALITAMLGFCTATSGCAGHAEPTDIEPIAEVKLAVSASDPYLFATFDGDAASEEHLFIYTSSDGASWSLLADTGFAGPTGVLRDPSIIKNPGDGRYYIAYTVHSWDTTSTSFNIASSTNLTSWTHVTSVNANVTGTSYTWAPEFFVEGTTVRVVASLSPSNAPWAFRSYYYTALNTSLSSWSGATAMAGIGPNIIDTFVVKRNDVYHAFTQNGDSLYEEHATASSLAGPWTYVATGDWAGWGAGKEGPALFQLDNGSWSLFADWYSTSGIYKATSADLSAWSSPLVSVTSLSSKRHGTVWRNLPIHQIESYNFPDRFVRHYAFRGKIEPSPLPFADSQFKTKPGLSSASAISFESVNFPNYFLRRRSDNTVWVDQSDNTPAFKKSATWFRRAGLADPSWSSYESYELPGQYIRHFNYELIVSSISTTVDRQDATFREQN